MVSWLDKLFDESTVDVPLNGPYTVNIGGVFDHVESGIPKLQEFDENGLLK